MTETVGHHNPRWISHRITAHKMHRRGASIDAIADHLRVAKRSVHRYLALECPEPPPVESEINLSDFHMQGACGAFPELDWTSRSQLEQTECKAVCAHCPVLAQCRTWGLTKGRDECGVWGGLTKEERRRQAGRNQRTKNGQRPDVVAVRGQGAA